MNTQNAIYVSLGRADNFGRITKRGRTDWWKFAERLSRPKASDDKAAAGWYCPAKFTNGKRDSENFIERHALTFDFDNIEPGDVDGIRSTYERYTYLVYTTASHTPEKPRLRLVMPLSRPCDAVEFQCVTRTIGALFDLDKLARESDTPTQMMFRPTKRPGGEFWSEQNDAAPVDVDAVLDEYDDPADPTQWPRRSVNDEPRSEIDDLTPPDEKPGIVGDFCRAFDVPAAIDKFELPYERGSGDRWTYTAGTSVDGLRIYDDGLKAHSEHDTDPARGQSNAFDLVRLHWFGHHDQNVADDTPIHERPSYKRMCQFAESMPAVVRQRTASEFEDLGDDDDIVTEPPAYERKRQSAEQFTADLGPREWLVEDVLPAGAELVVVYGPTTAGKSFWLLDLVAAIHRGRKWRDKDTRRTKVLQVVGEGARDFAYRMQAIAKHLKCKRSALPDVYPEPIDLLNDKQFKNLLAYEVEPGDLVTIDTLHATMGGNENDAEAMGRYVRHCKMIAAKTGKPVIVVHHPGKDPTRGARGSSSLAAAADAEIRIGESGANRVAEITKLKDGTDGGRFYFNLTDVELGTNAHGKPYGSAVVWHGGMPEPEKFEPVGAIQKAIMKTLNKRSLTEPISRTALIKEIQTLQKKSEPTNIRRSIRELLKDGSYIRLNKSGQIIRVEGLVDE